MFQGTTRLYACKLLANSSPDNLALSGLRLASVSEVADCSGCDSCPHNSLHDDRVSEPER